MPSLGLILPTIEESTLDIHLGESVTPVDVFTIRDLMSQAGEDAKTAGQEDNWRSFFISAIQSTYGIELSPTAAFILVEAAYEQLEVLKKKSSPLLGRQDSSEEEASLQTNSESSP